MQIEHEFLKNKNLIKLMNVLNQNQNNASLIVGGAVRNALLNIEVIDIDIATIYTPQEVIKLLENANIRYVPTGLEHGTISAIINSQVFEITTLRNDIITDGRHAIISYTDNWLEDAKRRDFTMNALYCDINGQVFDPLKIGFSAIKNRKIEFVGDVLTRIKEDYLRILRFFRFYAQLPNFTIDNQIIAKIAYHSEAIKKLSSERIWAEIKKICNGKNWFNAFALIFEFKILNEIFGIENQNFDFKTLNENLLKTGQSSNEIMILANIIDFKPTNLDKLQNALRLSNNEKSQLKILCECVNFLKNDFNSKNLKIAANEFGQQFAKMALLIGYKGENIIAKINEIENFEIKKFPIDGKYLNEKNILPSPKMGKILAQLKTIWLENDFSITEKQIDEIIEKFRN